MQQESIFSGPTARVMRLIAISALVAVCLYNLGSSLFESIRLQGGTSYIGSYDAKFASIRLALMTEGSTQSVGYLLDAPFEKLPNELQGYYLQARYGLAPILVRPSTAEDTFVILDARARLRHDVPSRLRMYKDLGDGIFLLKAAR